MRVLVVGATGNVGKGLVGELLKRKLDVRVIVRSPQKFPTEFSSNTKLEIIHGSLLDLEDEDMLRHTEGCDAVVSCLGHVPSFKGIWGPPYSLVTDGCKKICSAINKLQPVQPVKFVLLTATGINHPDGSGGKRGIFESGFIASLRFILPPVNDNQKSANYLYENITKEQKYIEWTIVRPDSFIDGEVSEYTTSENLLTSIFQPQKTTILNIGHFMAELIENTDTWNQWKWKAPVIINKNQSLE